MIPTRRVQRVHGKMEFHNFHFMFQKKPKKVPFYPKKLSRQQTFGEFPFSKFSRVCTIFSCF